MLASSIFVALVASISTASAQVAIANAQANAIAIAGAGAVTTPVVTVPAVVTPSPAPIANVTIPSGCYPTIPCTSTITAASTSTYCPVCEAAKSTGGVYTTVYCTTLLAICPTGYSSAVYTVTATVTGTTPVPAVPTGFTTTAVVCSGCPGTPTVVVTTPVGGTTVATVTKPAAAVFTGAASSNFKTIGAVAGSFGSVFAAMLLL